MKIIGLIWYENIIEKLEQKHNVQQHEVRGILANNPKFRYVENGLQPDENVYAALGRQMLEDILLFSLYTKKTNKRLLCQHRT